MNFNADHDRFVAKNRSLAAAYDSDDRQRQREKQAAAGEKAPVSGSCFNCKSKSKCPEFKAKRNGGTSGVVSFGGGSEFMRCDKYEAAPFQNRTMNKQQIKSLMKNFKRGF